MRIAIVNHEKCKPEKCGFLCGKACPRNRAGDKCIAAEDKITIDENLCIGCGLCIKKCPFSAIAIVNTPEALKEQPVHRFGKNAFLLYRLPFPVRGEIVGLVGQNGVGKSTALKILSGEIKPNLGLDTKENKLKQLITIFRGTELQSYLEELQNNKIKAVYKPQQIDSLANVQNSVNELLDKHDEKQNKSEVVKQLQLENCLERSLSQLSGGELQRVAIAITALQKADVYYFDEPSSYLDAYQRLAAAKFIRSLAENAAVMVVEHDLAMLDFLADKIHVFYGAPGCFGVVSKPYSVRTGINIFLDGYIREDNIRIHEPISFLSAYMPTAKKEILLEFENMEKRYAGFSLSVKQGKIYKREVLALFGANALGKTTFAKILAGVEKQDAGALSAKIKISYKPQYIGKELNNFLGTVSDVLSTVADIYSEEYRSSVLKPLGLESLLDSAVAKLSGGELQRVAIALCLSREAELYLLDEPSAFLDVEQRLAVAKLLRKFCEQKDCSAAVIDHDLLFLSYIGERAMLFIGDAGKRGTAEQMQMQQGLNLFLKGLNITFRKEQETGRPRANKPGSQKDEEQKQSGNYFLG